MKSRSPEERAKKYRQAAVVFGAVSVVYFAVLAWKRPPHPVEPWLAVAVGGTALLFIGVLSLLIWRGRRWLVLLLLVLYVGRTAWSVVAIQSYGGVFVAVVLLHLLVLAFLVRAGFDL